MLVSFVWPEPEHRDCIHFTGGAFQRLDLLAWEHETNKLKSVSLK